MAEYLVYTTEGLTSGPNINIDVENCQVLGTIEGVSEKDAINKLFGQNDWIQQAGFSIDNALARPLLTTSIMKDIRIVIDYLWKEEHRHFQENYNPKDPVFSVLKRLRNTL